MAGLLILIIDRGIIKVAFARGRFQLRISVSLGTIGPVSRREKEGERGEGKDRERNQGRMVEESSFACIYCPFYLLILYLLPQEDKPRVNNVRGFFQLIL